MSAWPPPLRRARLGAPQRAFSSTWGSGVQGAVTLPASFEYRAQNLGRYETKAGRRRTQPWTQTPRHGLSQGMTQGTVSPSNSPLFSTEDNALGYSMVNFETAPFDRFGNLPRAIRRGWDSHGHPRLGCGDERSPVNRYGADAKAHCVRGRSEMRVLGRAFAVLLAVTVPIVAHANGPQSNIGPANSAEYRASQLCAGAAYYAGMGWRRFGRALRGYRRPKESQPRSTMERRMAQPYWGPNPYYGGWGPYGGLGVPTHWCGVPVAGPLIIPSQIGEARWAGG
jgi:hypothetical protein